MKKYRYNITDKVYHITPESDAGVVLDCRYSLLADMWEYLVTFSPTQESMWYYEHELSETKVF